MVSQQKKLMVRLGSMKIKTVIKKSGLLIILFLMTGLAMARPNPTAMLQSTSEELMTALQHDRPMQDKADATWIYRLVDQIVLPHVDTLGMSRSVLGRNAWLAATPKQRAAFSRAFTRVVVQTYASALDAYTDETIQFFPLRENYEVVSRVFIKSAIVRPDGPPIPLHYKLIFIDGHWKIYDLYVEGVSLLQSFYSQFSSKLARGETLEQLIHELQQRYQGAG